MLVLHAAFHEDCLQVWGESALAEDAPKSHSLVKFSPYRTPVAVLRERLAEAGIEPSVGSKGDSYDNALAETINGLYKTELIYKRGPWKTL